MKNVLTMSEQPLELVEGSFKTDDGTELFKLISFGATYWVKNPSKFPSGALKLVSLDCDMVKGGRLNPKTIIAASPVSAK